MRDPYHAAVHGIAALRRMAERTDGALLGALGVAAEPLPHQIATVRRILAAPEIRHLIADGVGLGKTIQALMIINALRLADPRHRTLIVAPQHLLSQWDEELRTRAHVEPIWLDSDSGTVRRGPVELVLPSALLTRNLLAADPEDGDRRHDLLVLDEPQSYTQDQRRALARARPFSQLLLLSATPGLGDRLLREQVFRLIEPERSAIEGFAGAPQGECMAADERTAIAAVEAGTLSAGEAFERYAATRRICRWSRNDWPEIAARRTFRRLDVPMHKREAGLAERAAAEAALFSPTAAGDPLARAQSLHRIATGGTTIEDEVRGDSRFDALVDELAELWAIDPDAQVVVVAGDNPTIDRLTARLPQFLDDPRTGEPLRIVSFSRDPSALADANTAFVAAQETLMPFNRGEARLLIIGQWAQAGLNLQYAAQRIVFYSCPWNPRDVDQLIGRLDRLSKGVETRLHRDRPAPGVDIAVVTWRGSPEARVVDGLERLGVFEAPVPPTSLEVEEEIRDSLAALAAGRRTDDALATLEEHRADDLDTAALSLIADFNPHRTAAAWAIYRALAERPVGSGALHARDGLGVRGKMEEQLVSWLEVLQATRFLDCEFGRKCRTDRALRATSAWYASFGGQSVVPQVPILPFETTQTARLNAHDGGHAFNMRRKHMPQPPASRFNVYGKPRPLGFLDHGDALHDELCRTFLRWGRQHRFKGSQPIVVEVPTGSAAARVAGPILLSAYEVGLAPAVIEVPDGIEARADLVRRYLAGLRADDRFVQLARGARAVVVASRWDTAAQTWMLLPDDMLTAIVDPRDVASGTKAALTRRGPTTVLPRAALDALGRARDAHDAAALAARPGPAAIADRKKQIELESERLCRVFAGEAANIRHRIGDNVLQQRMLESQAENVERHANQARALTYERCAWLQNRATEPSSITLSVSLLFQAVER